MHTGVIIGIIIAVVLIIVGVIVGVVVWMKSQETDSTSSTPVLSGSVPDATTTTTAKPSLVVGTPVKISYETLSDDLCAGTTPSIITMTGTVTYVAGTTVGVTWTNMANTTPRAGTTTTQCNWDRISGRPDSWILQWFGTDKVNPTGNAGLLSVFDATNASKLQRVERFRSF